MKIIWLESVDSTQTYLIEKLKEGIYTEPTMVVAKSQTAGKGSRGNSWIGLAGNLFFSFCLQKEALPSDLPLSATSIYFSFILKQILKSLGSKVWMKWPNDFYLDTQKIGGTITNLNGNWLICGIGINLKTAPENFTYLDIDINIETLLEQYQKSLKNLSSWKKLLKEFEIEFAKSRNFSAHIGEKKIALADAKLADDGALIIDNQRIYSLR